MQLRAGLEGRPACERLPLRPPKGHGQGGAQADPRVEQRPGPLERDGRCGHGARDEVGRPGGGGGNTQAEAGRRADLAAVEEVGGAEAEVEGAAGALARVHGDEGTPLPVLGRVGRVGGEWVWVESGADAVS